MRGVTDKGLEQALEIKKRLIKSNAMGRISDEDYKRLRNKTENLITDLEETEEEIN